MMKRKTMMAAKTKKQHLGWNRKPAQAQAILKPIGPRYYFAYGSNLCVEGMLRRCPDAKKVKALQLRGCKLVFRGVADVEITDNENDWVEGGLWRISSYDESRLDSYEGVSDRKPEDGLYRKLTFPIGNTKDDTVWDCLIYKMNRKGIMPPSEHYFNIIKKGYDDFGLNLDKLNEALAASWDDKDRTPQLNARYDRNGRPPLARKTQLPPEEIARVVDEVVTEALDYTVSVNPIVQHFNDLNEGAEAKTPNLIAPDKWIDGASKECQPPDHGQRVTSNAPTALASSPENGPVLPTEPVMDDKGGE
jgi:hypothetical protein